MTSTSPRRAPARSVVRIATAAGGGFAAFYTFYTTASSTLDGTGISAGTRAGIVMLVVVAVQPLLLLGRNWVRNRRLAVMLALTSMGVGSAILPVANQWPGSLLLGLGFGVFVVMSTVWVKEQAAPGQTGRALGAYGFGSAAGGALGAPIGLYVVEHGGQMGVAIVGCAFALGALIPARQAKTATEHRFSRQTAHTPAKSTSTDPLAGPRASSAIAVASISLPGHLLAVSLYAAVLSSVGTTSGAWLPVLAALVIQVCLVPGRLVGGHLSDQYPPLVILVLAVGFLALSTVGFAVIISRPGTLVAVAVIGFASGVGQTAALTAMMRCARTPRATETASAGWNIAFDGGLGIGALAAGWMTTQG
ncbi:MFS transporter [Auritidibacter ignavus]|uniref:MFS transporter n=1 Tax=Auritidibacter ignavus TaxID=678932 RepID=A0AAJ6DC53_9MICC|nr:MFS transporter [Auritidibacter ignavus]WGH92791.1 MFS transporter [Auritidibacter ignavus]